MIDVASLLRESVIVLQGLPQRLPLGLQTIRHHERIAAERRRPRRAGKIVRHHDAGPGRLGDVDMAVDASRNNEHPGCIDNIVCVGQ